MFKCVFAMALIISTLSAQAEDKMFKGESEASIVLVDGNSKSQTISAKSKNVLTLTDLDLVTIFGSYTDTKATNQTSPNKDFEQTGKSWTAGIRYDRVFFKDELTGFVQHQSEADPFNGVFIQRDSTDLGAKYTIIKNDNLTWFAELGYRYTSTYAIIDTAVVKGDFARVYTEAGYKMNASVFGKLWAEYLSSFDTKKNPNRWNAEASLSVSMTEMLSLKTAYLINHTDDVVSPLKADKSTFTTAIVANY